MISNFKNIEIVISYCNENQKEIVSFNNENLNITQGRNLHIENISQDNKKSEFIESMKINFEKEEEIDVKTEYKLEVKGELTPIKRNSYYTIKSFTGEKDAIIFNILE